MYFYLTKPNGNNLLVAVVEGAQGWKMDYSPYSFGHYFLNLKILANYDKAYNQMAKKQYLKIAILPVTTFENALEELSTLYDKPFLDYSVSGGQIGIDKKINDLKLDRCVIGHIVDIPNKTNTDYIVKY